MDGFGDTLRKNFGQRDEVGIGLDAPRRRLNRWRNGLCLQSEYGGLRMFLETGHMGILSFGS